MSIFKAGNANSNLMSGGAQEIEFEKKTFLVVDDITSMRASMRITISTFGGVRIDMAGSANDAIYKIERKAYDIILCDYDLGEGKDGQQLLEEIKRRKLIKNSVIFMMVTAEQRYEKVVSAVEMAPDDYLIKPFTGETLRTRLMRLVYKKAFFAPVYDLMDKQEFRKAILICDELLVLNNQHMIDLLRLKGEIYLMLGEFDNSKNIYEQILAIRDIPWARMGLAKSLFNMENFEEAAEIFLQVTKENPNYMDAYDWLAKSYSAVGDDVSAQKVLMKVTAKSPRILPRQKSLGEAAYNNGDLDTALASFGSVLKFGKHSTFTAPEDFANMSRVYMDKGEYSQALNTMSDARKNFKHSPEVELHAAVMDSLVYHKSGDTDAAKKAFESAKFLYETSESTTGNATLDLANACFLNGDDATGGDIIKKLILNNHDNKQVLKQTESMFKKLGMEAKGKAIIQSSSRELITLNNRAVKLAQEGDIKGAVDLLIEAVNTYHTNTFITLNAAHAILVYMQKEGWDDDLSQTAKKYLQKVKERDPVNKKLLLLSELMKEIAQKFGIKT